jgi:hypothetical protein
MPWLLPPRSTPGLFQSILFWSRAEAKIAKPQRLHKQALQERAAFWSATGE